MWESSVRIYRTSWEKKRGGRKGAKHLARPGAVAGAGAADVDVGPLAVAAHAGVGSDELVALGSELLDGIGDDLVGGYMLVVFVHTRPTRLVGRVIEDHVGLGVVVGDAVVDRLGVGDVLAVAVSVFGVVGPHEELGVATVTEDLEDEVVVRAVWGAEVGGANAEDLDHGVLDLLKLSVDTSVVELGEVGVAPGVAAEGVAAVVKGLEVWGVRGVVGSGAHHRPCRRCSPSCSVCQMMSQGGGGRHGRGSAPRKVVVDHEPRRNSDTATLTPLRKKVALPPFRRLAMS